MRFGKSDLILPIKKKKSLFIHFEGECFGKSLITQPRQKKPL